MLRTFSHSQSFDKAAQETDLADRPARRTASSSWPIATTLLTLPGALREGLATHRRYEHLRSRGIPHDTALTEALGIRIPASEVRAARSQAAAQCRSHPLAGTARTGEAIVLRGQDLSGSANSAPRRDRAHIGNLKYVG